MHPLLQALSPVTEEMLMSGTLHRLLLLAWTCLLSIYGTPVHLLDLAPTQDCDGRCANAATTVGSTHSTDVKFAPSETEHVILDVGGRGGGGGPEGTAPVTQTENGDSLDGRSGPSEAGGEARSQRSEVKKVGGTSEMGDAHRQSEAASEPPVDPDGEKEPTGGRKQLDVAVGTTRSPPDGFAQLSITARDSRDPGGEDGTRLPGYIDSLQGTSLPSSTEPGEPIQKLSSHSPIPPLVFLSPRTSTPLSVWSHDGATTSSLPDPLLPEIGPNLMPREDGPESLWTEAARPGGGRSRKIRESVMEKLWECRLAQMVEWASHVQRLCPRCGGHRFESRPRTLCHVSLILFPVTSSAVLTIKAPK